MSDTPSILLAGASRGLGLAISEEFAKRGWSVVGTVRGGARTGLHDLAGHYPDRIEIEQLDITDTAQIEALRARLSARRFDIVFVNAGTANRDRDETAGSVATEEFVRLMVTNALAPLRVIEGLEDLVTPDGLIGIMSSGMGSVANNQTGGFEVYRGTKAAVNMYMRSYAARHKEDGRALLLLAPGWIRTELGGPDAPFSLEETVPAIVDTIVAKRGRPGLEYLDRMGATVPW
ncbi:MAG: SDR family oxidoreductase [Candidatus Andeanibacterium colombiense]|uniref:SDR family oxidoreductase n=1 Tax=Candidatus Andeanibacterium colombiense TaxID=3121345 RepID=A0AAJ5X8D3_9SPHN|nr:MAG: SDR family oxidoreductase [Sphingomonadaceae bacterium]